MDLYLLAGGGDRYRGPVPTSDSWRRHRRYQRIYDFLNFSGPGNNHLRGVLADADAMRDLFAAVLLGGGGLRNTPKGSQKALWRRHRRCQRIYDFPNFSGP